MCIPRFVSPQTCILFLEANALFLRLILALVEKYHNIVAQVANLRQPLCLKYTSASREYHNIVAQVANLRQPLCLKYTSASRS